MILKYLQGRQVCSDIKWSYLHNNNYDGTSDISIIEWHCQVMFIFVSVLATIKEQQEHKIAAILTCVKLEVNLSGVLR